MKLIVAVVGLTLIAIAVMYFSMPADQLPAFLPGYEAGVTRVHIKHGILAGAAGVALIAIAWMMSRRSAG